MTANTHNAFIQANLQNLKDGDNRVIMKVTGMLVDLLDQVTPMFMASSLSMKNSAKSFTSQF